MVTAVITTYKRPPEILERAIRSITAQTYTDWELIVVDDSPADYDLRPAVKETVEKYAAQGVCYIPHEKNQGACAARNTGLAAAKGEFIAYLDDDDEWLPEKLEKQLQAFEAYGSDTALVYCGRVMKNDTTGKQSPLKVQYHDGMVFDILIERNFIGSTSYPMMRTQVLREIGGFDPEMPASQDFDVWLRIAQNHAVGYVEQPLAVYHIHEGECITGNPRKKVVALERINRKHADYLNAHPHALWKRTIGSAKFYTAAGEYGKAWKSWCSAVAIRPGAVIDNLTYLRYMAANAAKFRKKG